MVRDEAGVISARIQACSHTRSRAPQLHSAVQAAFEFKIVALCPVNVGEISAVRLLPEESAVVEASVLLVTVKKDWSGRL